jgi:hypothetical protein
MLLALQAFHVIFLILHDVLPLGAFNDVRAVRAENPGSKLFTSTFLSTLPFAVGLAASIVYFGRPYPAWLVWYLWIVYVMLFAGELRAWWIPYLLVPEPARAARYRAMFGNTVSFLPERNGIRPNALHVILHAATVALLICLAVLPANAR